MIVYGTRGSVIHVEELNTPVPFYDGEEIVDGEERDTIDIVVFAQYAHIFWIPLFSIGKRTAVVAHTSGQEIPKKQQTPEIKQMRKEAKKLGKIPVWHFLGLGILVILIGFAFFQSGKHDEEVIEMLHTPQVGDRYTIDEEGGKYTLIRIEEVSKDSIIFEQNEYTINKRIKVQTLNKDENWTGYLLGFSKEEVQSMFDEKIIVDIDR